MSVIAKNEAETVAVARGLLAELGAGSVVYLHGDLGMGKSVFARGLVRAIAGDEGMEVPSPTFTLVQEYDGAGAFEGVPVYHFDLYRIEDEDEIFELGWEDAVRDGVVLVEWPSRLGAYMKAPKVDVTLKVVEGAADAREILIERRDV
jgi:tRNA threonylcarbamoyl adenosine modification protein YjeE